MKNTIIIKWLSIFLLPSFFLLANCTHEDELEPIPNPEYVPGNAIANTADGWNFDKAHSSVRWETLYFDGGGALLTGRFNDFGIEVNFDEANPGNITISAFVLLSTVNTGEPGRDAGCLLGTFGVAVADTAWFHSTSAQYYNEVVAGGPQFEVFGNLSFHGVTSEVKMLLKYHGLNSYGPEVRNGPYELVGMSGEFAINAKTIHGLETTNIEDKVTITVNGQFKHPL